MSVQLRQMTFSRVSELIHRLEFNLILHTTSISQAAIWRVQRREAHKAAHTRENELQKTIKVLRAQLHNDNSQLTTENKLFFSANSKFITEGIKNDMCQAEAPIPRGESQEPLHATIIELLASLEKM